MSDKTRILFQGEGRDGIPLDVANSLFGAIGVLYPNAKMGPGEHGRGFTLIIDEAERRNTIRGRKRAIAAKREVLDDTEMQGGVKGWDGETLTLLPPEELAEWLCAVGGALLTGMEGAANYVEQEAQLPDGRRFAMTLQWLAGATPHQKRVEAEAERDELRAEVERLNGLRAVEATARAVAAVTPCSCSAQRARADAAEAKAADLQARLDRVNAIADDLVMKRDLPLALDLRAATAGGRWVLAEAPVLPVELDDAASVIACPKCNTTMFTPEEPGTHFTLVHEADGSHTFTPKPADHECIDDTDICDQCGGRHAGIACYEEP